MPHTDFALSASECLKAWTSGDPESLRSLLSEDVTFDGPLGHSDGADAYVTGAAQMGAKVKGVTVKKLLVEGDDVCIMYDLLSEAAGTVPTVGWYHFRDDKIDSVRAYFDPRTLTADHRPPEPKKPLDLPFFAAGLQLCESAD